MHTACWAVLWVAGTGRIELEAEECLEAHGISLEFSKAAQTVHSFTVSQHDVSLFQFSWKLLPVQLTRRSFPKLFSITSFAV